MLSTLSQILISVFLVSLISLLGFLLFIKKKILNKILFVLVSFAAGSLLGAAFLDLIPEAIEANVGIENVTVTILLGILSFFVLQKFLYWHHHHTHKEETHTITYMNLIGDGIHNAIDGAVIAVSFMNSTQLGIVSTIAILAHELPQEISDFGVLIYGGFSKKDALTYNFITALTAFVGAIAAYFYISLIKNFIGIVAAFAAGGFIYIALTDLIPELQKEKKLEKSLYQFFLIILGMLIVWAAGLTFG